MRESFTSEDVVAAGDGTESLSAFADTAKRKVSYHYQSDDFRPALGMCGWSLTVISWILIFLTLPVSLCVCLKVVQEYERAVIFRLGRLLGGGAKGPGIFFVLPCIESYTKVDLRTVSFDVPPQEVLTKDSVTVSVDAVVYYRISNATVSVANVENAHHSTRLLAQTTLRNVLGTKNLSEILSERESISNSMQETLDDATEHWGIMVERVEIKDVRLPIQLQRAMAAEAEATREAKAKIIAAEGENQAAHSLKEASDTINKSATALQLRYLQTLNTISAEKNSTIIFPLPIQMMNRLIMKKKHNKKRAICSSDMSHSSTSSSSSSTVDSFDGAKKRNRDKSNRKNRNKNDKQTEKNNKCQDVDKNNNTNMKDDITSTNAYSSISVFNDNIDINTKDKFNKLFKI